MSETKGFKHVGLITKKAGQSFEEFVAHWLEVHSAIAVKVPGLRKYVINPIDREQYPDSPIDGFSELWFDSRKPPRPLLLRRLARRPLPMSPTLPSTLR